MWEDGTVKRAISIISLIIVLLLAAGCGSQTGTKSSQHTLTFQEGKIVSGEDLNVDFDMVGLFFEYTNECGETIMPADAVGVKAFQNGIELTVMVFTGQETNGYIQCDTSVQTGMTANVVWLFELQDTSTVSVECSDGQQFTVNLQ